MSATATVQFAVNNVPLCFNAKAQYSVYGKIYSHVDGGLYARMMPSTCVHILGLIWALKGDNQDIRA